MCAPTISRLGFAHKRGFETFRGLNVRDLSRTWIPQELVKSGSAEQLPGLQPVSLLLREGTLPPPGARPDAWKLVPQAAVWSPGSGSRQPDPEGSVSGTKGIRRFGLLLHRKLRAEKGMEIPL